VTWDLDPEVVARSQRVLQDRPFLWLYGIRVPEGENGKEIRLARSNADVTFDELDDGTPITWQAASVENSDFTVDSKGGLPSFEITIADARHAIGQKIEDWNYLTKPPAPVRVLIVHQDLLDDPGHAIALRFRVSQLTVNSDAVTARLSTYNFFQVQYPQDRVLRQQCRFTYGGKRCGFKIDDWDPGLFQLGPCEQTLEACEARGIYEASIGESVIHPERFGGFRGVPRTSA
jgi:phage-related protein